MEDALFLFPTPQVLQKVITGLDELYEHDIKDKDTLGGFIRIYAQQIKYSRPERAIPDPKAHPGHDGAAGRSDAR